MTSDDRRLFREALAKARDSFDKSTHELGESRKATERLEHDISNLRKTITALAAMCSEEPGIDKLGITESVMEVMSDSSYSWTTGEVVSSLESMGFDISSQKNAQASVHAVLTRLALKGKITRVKNAKKSSQGHPWEWRGPNYDESADRQAGFTGEDDGDDVPF